MLVVPHVMSGDDVGDEVNMGVEPPTNNFDFVVEVNMSGGRTPY